MTLSPEPSFDCDLCPRLVDFRQENAVALPGYHNAPVASFGPSDASFLIVGLAPGLHGANQTARPFTGDYAGDLLYATIEKFGFSTGSYGARADDGLELVNCMITNAVRCVPPKNKPIGTEITNYRPFLVGRIAALPNLKAILALGRIAHESVIKTYELRQKDFPFSHCGQHQIDDQITLVDSYHCSRYNTNTKRLTPQMFEDVFETIRDII